MKPAETIAAALITAVCAGWAVGAPAQTDPGAAAAERTRAAQPPAETLKIPDEMGAFLAAWTGGYAVDAVRFFSTGGTARRIRRVMYEGTTGYDGPGDRRLVEWAFINRVWRCRTGGTPPPGADTGGACGTGGRGPWVPMAFEALDRKVADDLSATTRNAPVTAEPAGRFLAAEAGEALMSMFMDNESAALLVGDGKPVLAMLLGVTSRTGIPEPGPFAAFWKEEADGWRIAAVGLTQP